MEKIALTFAIIIITFGAQAQADTSRIMMIPLNSTIRDNILNVNAKPDLIQPLTDPNDIIASFSKNDSHKTGKSKVQDYMMMKNGIMIVTKNGKTAIMYRDINLANGSTVMMNGTVIRRDGSVVKVNEGQRIDTRGNIVNKRFF